MEQELKGKRAVITGGSGVIGSVLAQAMSQAGAKIAIVNRSLERGNAVAQKIIDAGGDAIALAADVTNRLSIKAAADTILSQFGGVDILVNAAGGNRPCATTGEDLSFFDLSSEAISQVMDLNFLGTGLPTQVFGKIMADQGSGCIVNFASMSSYHPLTNTIAYSAAKSAIVNFTEWAATYFSQNCSPNIRVNAIAPGFLLTDQNRYLLTTMQGEDTSRGLAVKKKTPLGRYGRPEEMCGAVIYLCSDKASFVTGVVLPVDGGFSSYWGV